VEHFDWKTRAQQMMAAYSRFIHDSAE